MDISKKIEQSLLTVKDFPKKGINFFDISPLLSCGELFHELIEALARRYEKQNIDQVVALEARGFILGSALASRLKLGFTPIRKPGKLPRETFKQSFITEYSSDEFEIHRDALSKGNKVVVIDDVLATGGTALAAKGLLENFPVEIVEFFFLIEISKLPGRKTLDSPNVFSLLKI